MERSKGEVSMRDTVKQTSVFLPGYLTLILLFIVLVLASSCRDVRADASFDDGGLSFVPSTHLPGTLLRDARGGFWMVDEWPERSPVSPTEFVRSRLSVADAAPMTAREAHCLRNSGRPWQGRHGWVLLQHLSDRTVWYVDTERRIRRQATPPVIQAWHDDPLTAPAWMGDEREWIENYRDLGMMTMPDGALLHTEHGYAIFSDGETYPFASDDLARAAGYTLSRAVEVPEASLYSYGEVGGPITNELLSICPLAAAHARRDDDEDGDGATRANDCDDHDANRAPFLIELCDGIDNDCDGVVDNGFPVGFPCTLDDGCHSPGVTACNYDGWSVSCQNDEAWCE